MKQTPRSHRDRSPGDPRGRRSAVSPGEARSLQSWWAAVRGGWRVSRQWALRHVLTPRIWLLALGHLGVFAFVFWLAFLLRFEFELPHDVARLFLVSLPWVLAIKFAAFLLLGQFEGWWAYVTFADLIALVRAAVLSLFLFVGAEHLIVLEWRVPRSVLIMDFCGTIVMLGALRGSWRLYREQFSPMFNQNGYRWALLVGTDHAAGMLAHQIQSYSELPYRIRGLLATDNTAVSSRLGQIPILGKLEDVQEVAAATKTTDVLVTTGTLTGSRLRNLMNACEQAGLNLKIIRRLEDRLSGDHRVPIRDIEISDLLRRAPVQLDTRNIGKLLEGRIVMVTGAGGSIGSEICRQVLRFNPKALVMVGRGENRIFRTERRLRSQRTSAVLYSCIGDVTDEMRLRQLFEQFHPEVVFHAAAHKHVPLMENNPGEAVRNNVLGTKCVADLADQFRVRNFVFISTDKAVHPTSVMGVTKQIAERYVHALSQVSSTRFTVVRFGNVLGSDGSVVPIFQEQIRRGGPITVTDPRMTRFFMTIPEASQLVLQAAAMGIGGEIFVLEMGEPVKIVDLARDLIRLSGLPEDSIEIAFTGCRPGEKLYEELYFDDEETLPTSHPKVRAAYHRPYTLAEVHEAICALRQMIYGPEQTVRQKLREIVTEYLWSTPADGTDGTPKRVIHPTVTGNSHPMDDSGSDLQSRPVTEVGPICAPGRVVESSPRPE